MKSLSFTILAFSWTGIALLTSSDFAKAQEGIPFNDPYAARKVFYERQWQQKIKSALRFVEGAVVNVDVELVREFDKSIRSIEINGEPVAEMEVSKESSSDEQASRDDAQGPEQHEAGKKQETKAESQITNRIPTTEWTTSVAGLVPTNVSVCVTIPSSYYEKLQILCKNKAITNNQSDQETLAEIEEEVEHKVKMTVAALLPKELAENSFRDVVVTSFEDVTNLEPAPLAPLQTQRMFKQGDVITMTLPGTEMVVRSKQSGLTNHDQRIAVEIVDVKANGCLVIEGHRDRVQGENRQKLDVRGVIHASSVSPDATVPSSEVADLKLAIFESNE